MPIPRNNFQHAVYIMRSCSACGVADLGNFMHELSCASLAAKIERGEEPSDGEILERLVMEWRERNLSASPIPRAMTKAAEEKLGPRCNCPPFPWNPLQPFAHRVGCPIRVASK